jgi:hypothetical protein
MGRWDQNGSWGDWLGGCWLDSTVSGQRPVAGCCECGDESSGSCDTELGMSTLFHCTKLRLSKCNGSSVVARKQSVNFKTQQPAVFVFFVFRKSVLIISCSSSEDLSEQKISWSYVELWKFLHSPQKFERPPFWNGCNYSIKILASRSTSILWPPYWIS